MLVSSRTTNVLLVLMLAVGIGIVAMLASGVRGGPADPPGPPGSPTGCGSRARRLAARRSPFRSRAGTTSLAISISSAPLQR